MISPKSIATSTNTTLSERLVRFFKRRGIKLKEAQVGMHLGQKHEVGKEGPEGQKTLQDWCSPSSNLWGRNLGSESAASSPARQNGGSLQW